MFEKRAFSSFPILDSWHSMYRTFINRILAGFQENMNHVKFTVRWFHNLPWLILLLCESAIRIRNMWRRRRYPHLKITLLLNLSFHIYRIHLLADINECETPSSSGKYPELLPDFVAYNFLSLLFYGSHISAKHHKNAIPEGAFLSGIVHLF